MAIHQKATLLFAFDGDGATSFNQEILKASGPIQGLVIDYPEVATMQKHAFAKYKSMELGLTLLGPQGAELRKQPSEEIIQQIFSSDPETVKALKALLVIEVQDESFKVLGRSGQFDLLAPGVNPVFFEFNSDQSL